MSNRIRFIKVRDVKTPSRGNKGDAGIDFYIPNDFEETTLLPNEDVLIDSGIKVVVPKGYALIFKEKSSVATKKKLTIGASVVDADYRGNVHFHLFNNGKESQTISAGDKIVQGLLIPVNLDNPEEISNDEYTCFENTNRGAGGFGSTGNN